MVGPRGRRGRDGRRAGSGLARCGPTGTGRAGEAELGQPDSGDWAGAVMVLVPVVWWVRRACLVEMTCSNPLSACLADGEPPRTVPAADAQVCLARCSPVISCTGRRAAPPAGASEGRTWPPARCRRGHATGRSGLPAAPHPAPVLARAAGAAMEGSSSAGWCVRRGQ
jgi:hypothetical protein